MLPWRPFRDESGTGRGPGVWEEDGLPGTLGAQQGPAAAPTELRTRPTAPLQPRPTGECHIHSLDSAAHHTVRPWSCRRETSDFGTLHPTEAVHIPALSAPALSSFTGSKVH